MASWRDYEKQIFSRIGKRATGPVKITADTSLPGRLSKTSRQIDILVEGSFAGIADATMIVDCKCWSSKVDVKDMESFIGMVEDVGAHLGMLVTTEGFTAAAQQRGARVIQDVVPYVDIAIFDEANEYWLEHATDPGWYRGDYVDHEPYGRFWWVVSFVRAADRERDQDWSGDPIWSDDDGGWEGRAGARSLATLLIRHRTARDPEPDEVALLAAAILDEAEDGQGFEFVTWDVDGWIAGTHHTAPE